MKILNTKHLPEYFFHAVESSTYRPNPNTYSVTQLIGSPLIRTLLIEKWDELSENVEDRLWALHGRALDDFVKEYSRWGLTNIKLRLETPDGIVVGRPDYYNVLTHILGDLKETCMPISARILTRRGFKNVDEVFIGELVAAYDIMTDSVKWTPLLRINKSIAPTVLLKNKSFEIRCTENHKWFAKSKNKLRAPTNPIYIKKTKELKKHEYLVCAAYCPDIKNTLDVSPLEAYLIGWSFTDGCYRPQESNISIYQSKKSPFYKKIKEMLGAFITGEYCDKNNVVTFHLCFPMVNPLFHYAGIYNEKDLPAFVCRLTPQARREFRRACYEADSCKKSNRFSKNKDGVFEAFQIACTLEGTRLGKVRYYLDKRSGKKQRCTTELKCPNVSVVDNWKRKTILVKEHPRELVWCPTTRYDSWICEFEGQICITGNSIWNIKEPRKDWEYQLNSYDYMMYKLVPELQIDKLEIHGVGRDWRKNEKLRYRDYPDIPVQVLPINRWSHDEQEQYIHLQMKDHLMNPYRECSDEEKWKKEDQYAVMQMNRKSAHRVLDTNVEALTWALDNKKATKEDGIIKPKKNIYIQKRKGECVKCNSYCSVSSVCPYHNKETK